MNAPAAVIEANTVGSTKVQAKVGRCVLVAARAINLTTAAAFLQIFDAANVGDVTLGTTIPRWVVESPASGVSVGDGLPTDGITFLNGIVIASTTQPVGSTGANQHVRLGII